MRLRTKNLYKMLALSGTALFVCIIFFKALSKNPATDEFISIIEKNSAEITARQLTATAELLNLPNFKFLIENNLCHTYNNDLLGIIIVTSYVGHDELRAAHRLAITQSKLLELGLQRIFLLASVPEREHFISQSQVQNEQQRFGDLLQGNFVEAYRNLSYKHIMGLQWATTQCRNARFILKIDDDIVYDIFQIKRYLEFLELEISKSPSSELLAGYVLDSKSVIRNQASKWYVSQQEYSGNVYPSYLSGWLYITNSETALRFVQQSTRFPMFWIDDIWVTGILRETLHIPMKRLNFWFSANPEFLNCCIRDLKSSSLKCEFFVGPNGGNSKLLIECLHSVEKCYYDKCKKRSRNQNLKTTCVGTFERFLLEHGEANINPIKLGR